MAKMVWGIKARTGKAGMDRKDRFVEGTHCKRSKQVLKMMSCYGLTNNNHGKGHGQGPWQGWCKL